MKINKLRKQDIVKTKEELEKKQKELVEKQLDTKMGKEKNTSIVRQLRREIARIRTIIEEKEVLNEL